MKKIIIIILVLAIMLVGCGKKDNSTDETKTATSNIQAGAANNGFIFESKGVDVVLNAESAPIIEKLGTDYSYFESQSCAFVGLDKMYTYNGFVITTYEEDGKDIIYNISLRSDLVSTKEGVSIGDTLADIEAKYGSDYIETDNVYSYKKNGTILDFILNDGTIEAIEYSYDLMVECGK